MTVHPCARGRVYTPTLKSKSGTRVISLHNLSCLLFDIHPTYNTFISFISHLCCLMTVDQTAYRINNFLLKAIKVGRHTQIRFLTSSIPAKICTIQAPRMSICQ